MFVLVRKTVRKKWNKTKEKKKQKIALLSIRRFNILLFRRDFIFDRVRDAVG